MNRKRPPGAVCGGFLPVTGTRPAFSCTRAIWFTPVIFAAVACGGDAADHDKRITTVTAMPGLVAFWDFTAREPAGEQRFVARVPADAPTNYPLDAGNYVRDYWGAGREATYADFPLLGRGPFGEAIRIQPEKDPNFRPFLFVPRSRLHDTPLDIKGDGVSLTVVVWAIRESGNHALAGIWHEGTDLRQDSTQGIRRVERGQPPGHGSRPVANWRRCGSTPGGTPTASIRPPTRPVVDHSRSVA